MSLCRDASIIVRTSAINALGELLTVRPSEIVLNAFLDGPLHQVSDPETKVPITFYRYYIVYTKYVLILLVVDNLQNTLCFKTL